MGKPLFLDKQEKIPCIECLLFVMCKVRMYTRQRPHVRSVSEMADRENCEKMLEFLDRCHMDGINEARVLFDLEEIK